MSETTQEEQPQTTIVTSNSNSINFLDETAYNTISELDKSKADKVLAWAVFCYFFIFSFIICFMGTLISNIFVPWSNEMWGMRFFILSIIVPGIIGVISTIWFSIGGIADLRALFRDLANRHERDNSDDGRVTKDGKN